MDQNQTKAQNQKGFFLEEDKSKKRFSEGKLIRGFFKKGLNDLLQTKQGSFWKQKQQIFWSVTPNPTEAAIRREARRRRLPPSPSLPRPPEEPPQSYRSIPTHGGPRGAA